MLWIELIHHGLIGRTDSITRTGIRFQAFKQVEKAYIGPYQ